LPFHRVRPRQSVAAVFVAPTDHQPLATDHCRRRLPCQPARSQAKAGGECVPPTPYICVGEMLSLAAHCSLLSAHRSLLTARCGDPRTTLGRVLDECAFLRRAPAAAPRGKVGNTHWRGQQRGFWGIPALWSPQGAPPGAVRRRRSFCVVAMLPFASVVRYKLLVTPLLPACLKDSLSHTYIPGTHVSGS
jgi:hypothetical protein